jgi:KUP system potassium uptake protein
VRAPAQAALILGTLGVVFGDLGTSPLYTIQTVFNPDDPHPVAAAQTNVYGIVSLIFWAVTIIVTLHYVLLVMRADNEGEGGIMALITLIRRRGAPGGRRVAMALAALGIFGASLFFGDSMITPAISVLSAVEGLKVVEPSLEGLVVPITAAIIVVLFAVQRIGTAAVGRLFGPVMVVWFVAIGVCGVAGIARNPEILKALSPTYAGGFLIGDFSTAFFALAAVVLAVTGAEALYADMGHFGRVPIARAWLLLVFPACILSYFGQGALVLEDPANITSPFFLLVPDWGRLPMVFLATAATVIASQAVITGTFSVVRQAVQLGYLPRLHIAHTSRHTVGQIYVPYINWVLMVSVLTLVVAFRTSAALAFAFGMAVTGTITITTLLFFYVVRNHWGKPLWQAAAGAGAFLIVDGLFLAANATKLLYGAWLPLLIGVGAFTVLATWRRGRELTLARIAEMDVPTGEFLHRIAVEQPVRVPGTAVYLTALSDGMPRPLVHNLAHNHVLHEHVVLYTSLTRGVPRVPPERQLTITEMEEGIVRVIAAHGFMDRPNVPAELALARRQGLDIGLDDISYFLSDITLTPDGPGRMARWRKRLFSLLSRNSMNAAQYLQVPSDRAIAIGTQLDL